MSKMQQERIYGGRGDIGRLQMAQRLLQML